MRTQFHKGSVAPNVPAPTTINPTPGPGLYLHPRARRIVILSRTGGGDTLAAVPVPHRLRPRRDRCLEQPGEQVVNAAPTAREGARVHGMISALVAAGIEARSPPSSLPRWTRPPASSLWTARWSRAPGTCTPRHRRTASGGRPSTPPDPMALDGAPGTEVRLDEQLRQTAAPSHRNGNDLAARSAYARRTMAGIPGAAIAVARHQDGQPQSPAELSQSDFSVDNPLAGGVAATGQVILKPRVPTPRAARHVT